MKAFIIVVAAVAALLIVSGTAKANPPGSFVVDSFGNVTFVPATPVLIGGGFNDFGFGGVGYGNMFGAGVGFNGGFSGVGFSRTVVVNNGGFGGNFIGGGFNNGFFGRAGNRAFVGGGNRIVVRRSVRIR